MSSRSLRSYPVLGQAFRARGGLLLGLVLLAGCPPSHLPLRTSEHLRMPWAGGFGGAVAEATRTNKPILACFIAGQIDGLC